MSLLEVRGLRAGYGIVEVLFGLDLDVDAGELVVVLGANGSGKTTTLRAISGMLDARGDVTFDGTSLIQSDGSARLTFRSPVDFSPQRELLVLRAGRPQFYLNELEWVNGEIWANVWQSDEILRIDPQTGRVTGVLDASQLLSPTERRGTDVLNGIAWEAERGLFLLTGKLWPRLFAVKIRPAAVAAH